MSGVADPVPGVPIRSPVLSGTLSKTQEAFTVGFGAYMTNGVKDKLFAFVDRLGAADLNDCASVYFTLDAFPLTFMQERSRALFAHLTEKIASKSIDAGLVVGVLTNTSGQTWCTHYRELGKGEKSSIDRAVNKQKAKLPKPQRAFVEACMSYMKTKTKFDKVVAALPKSMKPADLQACVRLYLEVSQAFEEQASIQSLDVFYLVSDLALTTGRSTFALEYEKRKDDAASLLHARFEAMGQAGKQGRDRQDALNKKIKKVIEADAPPPGSRPGETKLPPLNKEQADFVTLYRTYVDGGSKKQLVAFQNSLTKPNGNTLAGFVAVYLDDSVRRYGEPASKRSLEVFFGTLSIAIAKSSSFYAIKVKSYIDAKDSLWARRVEALNVLQYGNQLRAQIDEKIKKKRLIDDLKVAFWLKNNRDPTLAELRSFNPNVPGEAFKAIDSALGDIDVAVGARAFDSLDKAYSSVAAAIEAETEPKARWMLVKHILERNHPSLRFRHLAYLQGVGLIYMACVKAHNILYANGFDQEETELFFAIDEGKTDRYFADFAAQIEGTLRRRGARARKERDPAHPDWEPQGKNDDAYTLLAKAEAALMLSGDVMDLPLTPPLAAAALRGCVEKAWDTQKAKVDAIRIRFDAGFAGKADLGIAQTIGNIYILWWDGSTAYVHVNGYEKVVFEANLTRLIKLYADYSFYGKLKENTEALGEVIPFMFEVIGYIPDLVSGGLTGLLKSVLFNLAFDQSVKALGIDPTNAQLLMLGMALLHEGLQPKAEEAHLGTVPEPAISAKGGGPIKGEFFGQDIGHMPAPEVPPPQFFDIPFENPRSTAGAIETGLPSNQGYDPRGLLTADGEHAIGLHDGGVGGDHPASSTPLLDERKTGPAYAATEDTKTTRYPADMDRATDQRQIPQQQQVQQQQSRVNRGPVDPVGRSMTDTLAADKSAQRAERLEGIKNSAGEQRINAAKRGTSGESFLDTRPIGGGTKPAQMSILGNKQAFDASLKNGYQVYMWKNAKGEIVYVGLSGRTLEHGTGVTPLSDWHTRLTNSHVDTLWIENATSLEVVSNLTYEQMNLLEEQLIKENFGKPYNFNEIANPDAMRIVREGIPELVIPTNAKTDRFGVVITGRR